MTCIKNNLVGISALETNTALHLQKALSFTFVHKWNHLDARIKENTITSKKQTSFYTVGNHPKEGALIHLDQRKATSQVK